MFCTQPATVGEFDGVRVEEAGVGADEGELARGKRAHAVAGEVGDDCFLPRMNCLHVGTRGGNLQAEGFAFLREMQQFGDVEQRLRRHAAAKNAKPAEVARTVDDGGAEAKGRGGAGGVEAGAAPAEDKEVVEFHVNKGRGLRESAAASETRSAPFAKQHDVNRLQDDRRIKHERKVADIVEVVFELALGIG